MPILSDTLDVAVIVNDLARQATLVGILQEAGFTVETAVSAQAGVELLMQHNFRVLLCDTQLPDADGLQFIKSIRRDLHLPGTYMVLMSGSYTSATASAALEAGADDYVRTPIDQHEVIARLRVGLRLWETQEKLRQAAVTDGLTGFFNQDHFHRLLNSELKRSRRFGDRLALIMVDVDHFKAINDTFGHMAGNQALIALANDIRANVRDVDTAARFGGDEMVILLPQAGIEDAMHVAERIRLAVMSSSSKPELFRDFTMTCSFGIAGTDDVRAHNAASLLDLADRALYRAKHSGRNCIASSTGLCDDKEPECVIEYSGVHELRRQMASLSLQAKETYMQSVASLLQALDEKDPYTARHAHNVAFYAQQIAKETRLDADLTQTVFNAALLHDIGKVGVPDAILMKHTPLSQLERMVLEQVPLISTRIVDHLRILEAEVPFIRHQREYYDGSGLPSGLVGDQIPIGSRILLVADAFDAMTTERVYRHRCSIDAALAELGRNAGGQFDPKVVAALTQALARERADWQERINDTMEALRLPAEVCTSLS